METQPFRTEVTGHIELTPQYSPQIIETSTKLLAVKNVTGAQASGSYHFPATKCPIAFQ